MNTSQKKKMRVKNAELVEKTFANMHRVKERYFLNGRLRPGMERVDDLRPLITGTTTRPYTCIHARMYTLQWDVLCAWVYAGGDALEGGEGYQLCDSDTSLSQAEYSQP